MRGHIEVLEVRLALAADAKDGYRDRIAAALRRL